MLINPDKNPIFTIRESPYVYKIISENGLYSLHNMTLKIIEKQNITKLQLERILSNYNIILTLKNNA